MSIKTAINTKMFTLSCCLFPLKTAWLKQNNIWEKREDQELRGIKWMLGEMLLPHNISHNKLSGWIDFNFASKLFCSFFDRALTQIEWFRDLLNLTFGIPVLLYRNISGKQSIQFCFLLQLCASTQAAVSQTWIDRWQHGDI